MRRYFILCVIGIVVTAFAQNPARKTAASSLIDDPRVSRVLEFLHNNVSSITEEQIRITEIPAPPFHEANRAAYLEKLLSNDGLRAHTDSTGNVIGEFVGASPDVVMVTAHLDTVFPAETDVRVKRDGARLLAPGISDNGTGLAALLAWSALFATRRSRRAAQSFSSRTWAKKEKEIFVASARSSMLTKTG